MIRARIVTGCSASTTRCRCASSGAADPRSGELRKNGARIKLQEQPFQVLELLVARAGELISPDELRQMVWPGDTFVDFDNGLNIAVRSVRRL